LPSRGKKAHEVISEKILPLSQKCLPPLLNMKDRKYCLDLRYAQNIFLSYYLYDIQLKPLNVITLGQARTDNINQRITKIDYCFTVSYYNI
jgi:hypothetical protein